MHLYILICMHTQMHTHTKMCSHKLCYMYAGTVVFIHTYTQALINTHAHAGVQICMAFSYTIRLLTCKVGNSERRGGRDSHSQCSSTHEPRSCFPVNHQIIKNQLGHLMEH